MFSLNGFRRMSIDSLLVSLNRCDCSPRISVARFLNCRRKRSSSCSRSASRRRAPRRSFVSGRRFPSGTRRAGRPVRFRCAAAFRSARGCPLRLAGGPARRRSCRHAGGRLRGGRLRRTFLPGLTGGHGESRSLPLLHPAPEKQNQDDGQKRDGNQQKRVDDETCTHSHESTSSMNVVKHRIQE